MTPLSDTHTAVSPLAGRKAIITGGTTGIGRAIAVLLASEGAEVFICGRSSEHLADALARIGEVGKGNGIALDLAEPGQLDRFFDEARSYLGSPDIVIVNAAVPAQALSKMSADEIRYAVEVDFTAYILSAKSAQEILADKGDIVLIGSMSAHILGPGSTVYAGMKAGIAGFAEALRRKLGPKE
ncbi:SDR family NAD(P)-dependent oxidoreductase [Novosphingobium sp. KA1]|uniref:SDR family NAD(P)-dependent oxidoreductase n=1 Tax=Novosphingobium sp. (strain KA1) TaxID=164608 RepID=UPI001F5DD791|nr:SDR family oxidoreductase [Novosphingobium sp. KA1]